MTYYEHVSWCKSRALALLPANPHEALMSMISDLRKHPETENHPGISLGMSMLMAGFLETPGKVHEFIEGFN